ncbi:MAG TPA: filamentous hemagglutinin N-terminal domain-containing protein, partial [Solimonas sp.]|nr:filamentous hemagglutinin N-terminal domain-containing protein [Solimonas sp.]
MNKIRLQPLPAALRLQRWSTALAALAVPGLALANPSGAAIVAGQVGLATPDANTLVVNQASQNAVINWQQFSVGGNEFVVFNQPNASAAVLNRVVGGMPSEILGNITANGRVFLVNPQGILFGQGSRVDVGSLVASTLNIADADFLAGKYTLTQGTARPGAVTNQGSIHAADGGFVVLAGDSVSNSGL